MSMTLKTLIKQKEFLALKNQIYDSNVFTQITNEMAENRRMKIKIKIRRCLLSIGIRLSFCRLITRRSDK